MQNLLVFTKNQFIEFFSKYSAKICQKILQTSKQNFQSTDVFRSFFVFLITIFHGKINFISSKYGLSSKKLWFWRYILK